jgi:hypothetical protein
VKQREEEMKERHEGFISQKEAEAMRRHEEEVI